MEYVLLRSSHPSWLTLQLPSEAAGILQFRPPSAAAGTDGTGSVSFLGRGPGIARVIASHLSREALAIERLRGRFLATARPGERHLFSIPSALLQHLAVAITERGARRGRGTDDRILWFLPSAEYHDFHDSQGALWKGPSMGGAGHLYVCKAELPLPRSLSGLEALERSIELQDWKPGIEALGKVSRDRKAA